MRIPLLSLALVILLSIAASASASNPPVELRQAFAPVQPNCSIASDCGVSTACSQAACLNGDCVVIYSPNGFPCDDGNLCTTDDACNGAGFCLGGAPLSCDDGVFCTADSCEPWLAGGCIHTPFLAAFEAPAVAISRAGTGIKLSWGGTGAEWYQVLRSTDPYFGAGSGTSVGSVTSGPLEFTDPGVLDDSATNYNYRVDAVCLGLAKPSGVEGEFGFAVTQGQ